MRIGIHTAQVGLHAGPDAVRSTAIAAEQIGYSSIWVLDQLPDATSPRDPGGDGRGERDGSVSGVEDPAAPRRALDPFIVLAATAAATTRVRVGTSVLVAPWYPPALLARLLTSLDIMSAGRLVVGLGPGRSRAGLETVGGARSDRAVGLDEALDVLDAHWSEAPVADEGGPVRIGPSSHDRRPVARPRPAVLLAGCSPAGLDRIARRADGWNAVGLAVDALAPTWDRVRRQAAAHGRAPDALQLVVRADIRLERRPVDGDRASYHGSLDQVVDDLVATRDAGADEVILRLVGACGLDEMLDGYARIADGVGLDAVAVGGRDRHR